MLLLDDLILGPGRFMWWIFRQIQQAAEQEQKGEASQITQQMAELYHQLETGAISEDEFDSREHALLDRLETIKGQQSESPKADQSSRNGNDDQ